MLMVPPGYIFSQVERGAAGHGCQCNRMAAAPDVEGSARMDAVARDEAGAATPPRIRPPCPAEGHKAGHARWASWQKEEHEAGGPPCQGGLAGPGGSSPPFLNETPSQ